MAIQLELLQKRLAEKQISLELSPEALNFLAEVGYDPAYGARPLKRALKHYLETPLAYELMGNNINEGDLVRVEAGDEKLIFKT